MSAATKRRRGKRQLFLPNLTTERPIKLSNLQVSASGTVFVNDGAGMEDVPPHTMQFKYCPPADL